MDILTLARAAIVALLFLSPIASAQAPFAISNTSTVSISATTSSANVALPSGVPARQLRIFNNAGAVAFVAFGGSGITASTSTSVPIAVGAVEVLSIPSEANYVAAILASGTGSIYFTVGFGY